LSGSIEAILICGGRVAGGGDLEAAFLGDLDRHRPFGAEGPIIMTGRARSAAVPA